MSENLRAECIAAAAKAFNGTYRDNESREFVQAPWQHDLEDMAAAFDAVLDTLASHPYASVRVGELIAALREEVTSEP